MHIAPPIGCECLGRVNLLEAVHAPDFRFSPFKSTSTNFYRGGKITRFRPIVKTCYQTVTWGCPRSDGLSSRINTGDLH